MILLTYLIYISIYVIIFTGVTLAVLYPVITIETQRVHLLHQSSLFITASRPTAFLLNLLNT